LLLFFNDLMSCPTKKKAQRPIKHFPTDLIIIYIYISKC
jgi:hypothetical protein